MHLRSYLVLLLSLTIARSFGQDYPYDYYPLTAKKNYVRTWTANVAEKNPANLVLRPTTEVLQSTEYFDGIGRSIQTVMKQGSPQLKDMVEITQYDEFSRVSKKWLPYTCVQTSGPEHIANNGEFKYEPYVELREWRSYNFGTDERDAFERVVYDGSPLNRVIKTMKPGAHYGYSNVGVTQTLGFNTTDEKIHIWDLDYTSLTPIPETNTTTGLYTQGQLSRMITTDEKGKKQITYTDNSGHLVLKKTQDKEAGPELSVEHGGWACTYFVYDHFSQLRYIITPKAVEYLDNNGWVLTQAIVDELCFTYRYDDRGRMIYRKQPGTGPETMVYDYKDRLVLTQHANQDKTYNTTLTKNQWTFILYDDLDRRIATGLLSNDAGRDLMQTTVNALGNGITSIVVPLRSVTSPGTPVNLTISVDNPVAGTTDYLNGSTNVIYNAISLFDGYNFAGAKAFNNTYSFAYSPSAPNMDATVATVRTSDLLTGEITRKMDNDNNLANDEFIFTTTYYDEKGRNIQMLTENIKQGQDYEANQFDFAGRNMSTFVSHSIPGSTFTITSKNEYDHGGRLKAVSKKFNNSAYKRLTEFVYMETGQLNSKRVAPGYTGDGGTEMDIQHYCYNINGMLTGINRPNGNGMVFWLTGKYFSMALSYENREGIFNNAQYNGNLTGLVWISKGNPDYNRYDYAYDNLGRLSTAEYKYWTNQWTASGKDYSVYVEYEDRNGNLKSLKQMGLLYGMGVKEVDFLKYYYKDVAGAAGLTSNQVKRIQDDGNMLTKNGLLGDFKDGTNGGDDYTYDINGNLVKDLNKNLLDLTNPNDARGIVYDFQDKPVKMVLKDKSTVEYVYDASGEKLSRKVTKAGGSPVKTTYYIGDFIYDDNDLSFVLHEEGRIKFITAVNTPAIEYNAGTEGITWGSKQGVFEYFVKDHMGSTRMVLTEEIQKEFYHATMDQGNSFNEERLFGKVDNNGNPLPDNELATTRANNSTVGNAWSGNATDFVKLTATGGKSMGPNMLLKVMAGDVINAQSRFYYAANNGGSGTSAMIANVTGSLIGALLGGVYNPAAAKLNESFISNSIQTNNDFINFINTTQPNRWNNNGPRAYISVVFFDEQFKFIPPIEGPWQSDVGTAFHRVNNPNNPNAVFDPLSQKAPRNGWAFVYLSNESNESVYFDDFYVSQIHSRIAEETHYYPHALKIASLSSVKFARPHNLFGYVADVSEEEEESGYNEFDLRTYDPQIGRWTGVDPYEQFASPYIGMGNDPVNNIDEDGGEISPLGWAAISAATAAAVTYIALEVIENNWDKDKKIKNKGLWSFAAAFVAAGVGFATSDQIMMNNYNFRTDMGGGTWGQDFVAFYAGLFGFSGEIKSRLLCNGMVDRAAVIPNMSFIGPEIYGAEYDDWKTVFKWTARVANSYFTSIVLGGYVIPIRNEVIPMGPPGFDPNDRLNWRWEPWDPADQYYADPGDPNTVRRGVSGGRTYQTDVFDPNGNRVGRLGRGPGETGMSRGDLLRTAPLIYNKDWAKLQRRNGNSKFLKNRLKRFKFGFKVKKRFIYRKVYRKIFGIKIRIRKECLNCD